MAACLVEKIELMEVIIWMYLTKEKRNRKCEVAESWMLALEGYTCLDDTMFMIRTTKAL